MNRATAAAPLFGSSPRPVAGKIPRSAQSWCRSWFLGVVAMGGSQSAGSAQGTTRLLDSEVVVYLMPIDPGRGPMWRSCPNGRASCSAPATLSSSTTLSRSTNGPERKSPEVSCATDDELVTMFAGVARSSDLGDIQLARRLARLIVHQNYGGYRCANTWSITRTATRTGTGNRGSD